MRSTRTIAVLASLALASLALAQEGRVLRLNVPPGTRVAMDSVTRTKMAFSGMMDREVVNTSKMGQTYSFEQGEGEWLKFAIATTEFTMEGEQVMDGMGPDPSEMVESIKKVRVLGEVSPKGAVRNVKLENEASLDMLSKGLMTRITEGMVQVGFFGVVFPETPIAVGTEWKANFNMEKTLTDSMMGMAQNVKGDIPYTFTVEAFEDVAGSAHAKVKVFADGRATFGLQGPMGDSDGTMTMTSLGHVWIDLATGLMSKSKTEMAMTIDIGMLQITQEFTIDTAMRKV